MNALLYRNALCQLRRENHDTFEQYCRDRWEMSRSHINRLVGACQAVKAISDGTNWCQIPVNEAQTRPLTKLSTPELQQQAWQQVIETAPKGKITVNPYCKSQDLLRTRPLIFGAWREQSRFAGEVVL